MKVAVVAAAGTVTDAGTMSNPLLLESDTMAPPLGAPIERVTVHVVDVPVFRLAGAHETELTVACAVSDSVALCETPL